MSDEPKPITFEPDGHFADCLLVREEGYIAIVCGGRVITRKASDWHALALANTASNITATPLRLRRAT